MNQRSERKDAIAGKTVVAIVANIKRFRVPFYVSLAEELRSSGIELRVVFSDPDPTEALRRDTADLPAPMGVKVSGISFLNNRALLQLPPWQLIRSADLLVV